MWFFRSPQVVFGENALSHLDQVSSARAFIVTDPVMQRLGFVDQIRMTLRTAGTESAVFTEIEPEPCLETVRRCAEAMSAYGPDWVIALGGGSCLDAAKAAWFLYERPDIELEAINPFEQFGLGRKARLLTIPTTAGSGAEVTAAAVIKDTHDRRKLEIASFELLAHLTIVDPQFSAQMPRQLTADTGIDVLAHAVEGFSSTWANDFSDGLCLQSARMVFTYLPRAVEYGDADMEAREKMANAATIAALGMTNSHIALAHALGHTAGTIFDLPHGRVAGLFLPYTIEYTARGGVGRYLELARILGLCSDDEMTAAASLAEAIRGLMKTTGLPLSLREAGVSDEQFAAELNCLCERAEMEIALATSRRVPYRGELERLFTYAHQGWKIDF